MASTLPYGTSSVQTPTMDFSQEGMFTTKTYHGLNIVINGNIIGRVQNWQPGSRTRTVTPKWELAANSFGRPIDLIPSKADGYTVALGRLEVWDQELEIVCGYGTVWSDLVDQSYPFVLGEQIMKGSTLYRSWSYPSCWFTSYAEDAATSEGDGAYLVNAEVAHLPRHRDT